MDILFKKIKEVLLAVVPITVIVLILHFTLTPMESHQIYRFLVGALWIVLGLSIFLVGVDLGITPIGNLIGKALAKSNKVWIVAIVSIIVGFFISVAEPDLHILAGQVAFVTSGVISKLSIVVIVSIGIAVLLSFGLIRIVYNIPLYKILTVLYLIILGLSFFTSSEFLAISFDASGATTGALTVPFILALALGVSSLKKDGKASEKDSFGLVAISSVGAILAVMVMSIVTKSDKITASLEYEISSQKSILAPFFQAIPALAGEILLALAPILLIFIVINRASSKVTRKAFLRILVGLVFAFIGLVLFLTGVNEGFMDVGSLLGYKLAALNKPWIIILVGFILGLVTILAEPAVYVLTNQIEDVTSGYVNKRVVLVALSIGVGFAVALSILRILVPEIKLWHYLLPGYIISIILSYFAPKLFVGIAFDSGGVASGPMTATFILAFAQGAAEYIEHANVLIDGFGVIAMVALTPLIALQIVGLIFKRKSIKGGIHDDGKKA